MLDMFRTSPFSFSSAKGSLLEPFSSPYFCDLVPFNVFSGKIRKFALYRHALVLENGFSALAASSSVRNLGSSSLINLHSSIKRGFFPTFRNEVQKHFPFGSLHFYSYLNFFGISRKIKFCSFKWHHYWFWHYDIGLSILSSCLVSESKFFSVC